MKSRSVGKAAMRARCCDEKPVGDTCDEEPVGDPAKKAGATTRLALAALAARCPSIPLTALDSPRLPRAFPRLPPTFPLFPAQAVRDRMASPRPLTLSHVCPRPVDSSQNVRR